MNALTVVDNTFLTPYFQKPLTLGADIVTHSSTKYLGGHNDTISGIVVIKDNEEIADQIHIHMKSHGSQLAPLDSWLVRSSVMPYCLTVAVQSSMPATASSMAVQALFSWDEDRLSLSITLIL